jgi:vitamin B12 transporter
MIPSPYRYLIIVAFLFCVSGLTSMVAAQEDDGRIIITEEDIAAMKAVRMADVLNQVPGLKAGDASVAIHGNYKVKVLVDGKPINDPTSIVGGPRWDLVSLENVERIEILRGKGGIEYGDNASGGVILISTKKIRKFSGNVKTYGGNYNTQSYSTNCRIVKEAFGGGLSAAYETTGGYQENNDKDKWRAGGKIEYTPNEENSYALSADYFEEERGSSGTPDYPTPYARIHQHMTSISLLSRIKEVQGKTYLNDGWKHNTDSSKNIDQVLCVKEAGQDISTAFSMGASGSINSGVAFQWGQADGTTLQEQEETALSVFGMCSYKLNEQPMTITAGLRGKFYSNFSNGVNPEIKTAWGQGRWNVSASFSRSNNKPSFHQRYNLSSSTIPNPDLKMETSDNYGLSAFAQISNSLSGGVTLFYNVISDRITYVRRDDGRGRYENVGEVTYKGGDISMSWKIRNNLTFKPSYTYLEARDETTGLWLTAKSRHKAKADLYYSPVDPFSLVISVEYCSKVYIRSDNSTSVPEYTIADVKGEYKLKHFNVFAEIQNLTDATYYYSDGILAPPRTWIVGVNWTF